MWVTAIMKSDMLGWLEISIIYNGKVEKVEQKPCLRSSSVGC